MKRACRALIVGALVGGVLAGLDGVVLGLILGDVPWGMAITGLAGATAGGLLGLLWTMTAHRFVLKPPDPEDAEPPG